MPVRLGIAVVFGIAVLITLALSACIVAPNWKWQMEEGASNAFRSSYPICVASAYDSLSQTDLTDALASELGAAASCVDQPQPFIRLRLLISRTPCVDCGPSNEMPSAFAEMHIVGGPEGTARVVFASTVDRSSEELVRSLARIVKHVSVR